MIRSHWGCWTVLAMLVGCNGKLVLPGSISAGAGGDSAGAGGDNAGAGGMSTAGTSGRVNEAGAGGVHNPGAGRAGLGGENMVGGEAGEFSMGGAPNAGSGGIDVGGAGGTIEPGQLGRPCIPGGTVREGSGFTATEIVTLDHCVSGLDCASNGKCAKIPDCPQTTGVCVLHRPTLGAEASFPSGTVGSSSAGAPGSGGFGQTLPAPTPREVGSLDLTADDSALYWVDYGTRDSLGNYQNDGVAMSYSFADKKTNVLASALAGPQHIVPTTLHAYIAVDGGQLVGSPVQNQVLRLPLAGGTPSAVGGFAQFIAAHSGDSLYLQAGDTVNVIGGEESAFTPFLTGVDIHDRITADSDSLYYTTSAGLERAPISGAPPTTVTSSSLARSVSGEWIYGLELIDGGIMLEKVAKSGGTWSRIKALGPGNARVLQMVGDRYFVTATFWDQSVLSSSASLLTGTLAAADNPVRIMNLTNPDLTPTKFVGTASAVYWTDGRAIYQRPLSDAPAP